MRESRLWSLLERVDNYLLTLLKTTWKGVQSRGPHWQTRKGNLCTARDNPSASAAEDRRASGYTTGQRTSEGVGSDMSRRRNKLRESRIVAFPSRPDFTVLNKHVTAWRFWKIDRDERGFCLRSLVVNQKWPKGALLYATCRHEETNHDLECGRTVDHQAPLFAGECGIYGYRTKYEALSTSLAEGFMSGRIIGEVALAGLGIHHQMGYRAYCAYPLSLVAGACVKCREIIPFSQARLGKREEDQMGKETDSPFVIYCEKHIMGEEAPFNWVAMLASQYGIRIGGLHEFLEVES